MLDRETVKEFLKEQVEEIEIPKKIDFDNLVEAFCQYTENDYYEWLQDNFNSFFEVGEDGIDWKEINKKIEISKNPI